MKFGRHIAQSLHALRYWLPVGTLCFIILFLAIAQGHPAGEIRLTYHDKVQHFFFYGFLATLIFRGLSRSQKPQTRWLIAIASATSFGLVDEILQHFNPSRQGDPLDWIADCIGAFTGIFAYRSATLYRRLLEFSPVLWILQKR